jgi:divalent metal cation (Fe/Co/Zn/Cd) transporter
LLWRLYRAGPNASDEEHGAAEKRALYLVAATFFLLAGYISYEAIGALAWGEGPESSTVGLVLSVLSILVMPTLAYGKQTIGREMGSRALQAEGVGLNAAFGWWWADPVGALAMLPVILWQGWETLDEAREEGEEE